MAPATIGPRQITASPSSGRSRFIDMIGMPPRDFGGFNVLPSDETGFSRTPNIRGIEGPVMSPSRTPTRKPRRFRPTARRPATSDFPTPPLPDITAMTCLMPFCSAMPRIFMPAAPAVAFAAGEIARGLPDLALDFQSRIRGDLLYQAPPRPVPAALRVSPVGVEEEESDRPERPKNRAGAG